MIFSGCCFIVASKGPMASAAARVMAAAKMPDDLDERCFERAFTLLVDSPRSGLVWIALAFHIMRDCPQSGAVPGSVGSRKPNDEESNVRLRPQRGCPVGDRRSPGRHC